MSRDTRCAPSCSAPFSRAWPVRCTPLQIGSINAGELAFQKSFDIVIMVVLGGLGSISGAALAAMILTLLPELLRDPPSIWPWGLVAAVIVAAMVVLFARRNRGPLITLFCVCTGWEAMRWLARIAPA